jgi:hypothetical protein
MIWNFTQNPNQQANLEILTKMKHEVFNCRNWL